MSTPSHNVGASGEIFIISFIDLVILGFHVVCKVTSFQNAAHVLWFLVQSAYLRRRIPARFQQVQVPTGFRTALIRTPRSSREGA